jgi:DNA-binding MurR/RpiR family transcriptional regulator
LEKTLNAHEPLPARNSHYLDQLLKGKRLTPAHRRVAQILVDGSPEVGYMSSMELAKLANVSQPSMTRFATALGFKGFTEMRNYIRSVSKQGRSPQANETLENKYVAAIAAEAANLRALAATLSDARQIKNVGKLLAKSRPLAVLGLRASEGLALQFSYYAAKVHPDIRAITDGGSLVEDKLEQVKLAGGSCVLAFVLPLYPRETTEALRFAKKQGLKVVAISDSSFKYKDRMADFVLTGAMESSLVFDSCAVATVLTSVLLDAMCDALPHAEKLLELRDKSSLDRKVFERS